MKDIIFYFRMAHNLWQNYFILMHFVLRLIEHFLLKQSVSLRYWKKILWKFKIFNGKCPFVIKTVFFCEIREKYVDEFWIIVKQYESDLYERYFNCYFNKMLVLISSAFLVSRQIFSYLSLLTFCVLYTPIVSCPWICALPVYVYVYTKYH